MRPRPESVLKRRIRAVHAFAVAAVVFTAVTGCSAQTLTPLNVSGVQRLTMAERFSVNPDDSYHGWWDEKPLPGQPKNLIIFSTKRGKVIQTIGTPPNLTTVNWAFLHSTRWAANVILVLGPARNRMVESFAVDAAGNPTNGDVDKVTIAGYEGWWNGTPAGGNVDGLPNETVEVSTRTGTVLEGFNRTTKSMKIKYTPHPDSTWPKNSIVIIDTSTNKVVASFPVDDDGRPLDSYGYGGTGPQK